ncbi:MAG: glycosyltransferase, partial [Myxococcota bacterium]
QHDPTYIGTMLDSLREGHEVVFLTYDRRAYGVFKVWGSKLNGFLATRLLGKPSSLYLSSFKAFRRGVRDRIVQYKGPFPYIDGLILGNTDRYTTLVGEHRSSLKERSSYTLVGLIEHALNMITSFSVRPLRMISILGCLIGVASVLLLAVLSVLRILYPAYAPPGWTMMVCLLTSFGALQLVCLGVVGEYVGRVLLHSGTRPQYAVRRRIGGGGPP